MQEYNYRLLLPNRKLNAEGYIDSFNIYVCSLNMKTSAHDAEASIHNTNQLWENRYKLLLDSNFFGSPIMDNETGAIKSIYNGVNLNSTIRYENLLDVIGFQEVTHEMYDDGTYSLKNIFNSGYYGSHAFFGQSSVTNNTNEGNIIFYNKVKFDVALDSNNNEDKGGIWLRTAAWDNSSNKYGYEIEGKNWADEYRTCAYIKLIHKSTKQKILVLNLHLPTYSAGYNSLFPSKGLNKGDAQRWSLNTLRQAIDEKILKNEISNGEVVPIILMGDFNANYDTFAASGRSIIESIVGAVRNEYNHNDIANPNQDIGTKYYFYNTTNYVGMDYTTASKYTLLKGNTNWNVQYALASYPDAQKARFDYIFASRWPSRDNVYDTNRRIYLTHNTNLSFVASPAPTSDNTLMFSDHCPIVSCITVNNPMGYSTGIDIYFDIDREKRNANFEYINIGSLQDSSILIRARSSKPINGTIGVDCDVLVGNEYLHDKISLNFDNSIYSNNYTNNFKSYYKSSRLISNSKYDSIITNIYNLNASSDIIKIKNSQTNNTYVPWFGAEIDTLGIEFSSQYNTFDISTNIVQLNSTLKNQGIVPYINDIDLNGDMEISATMRDTDINETGLNYRYIYLFRNLNILHRRIFTINDLDDYVNLRFILRTEKMANFIKINDTELYEFIKSNNVNVSLKSPTNIRIFGSEENIIDKVESTCEFIDDEFYITLKIPKSTGASQYSSFYIDSLMIYIDIE